MLPSCAVNIYIISHMSEQFSSGMKTHKQTNKLLILKNQFEIEYIFIAEKASFGEVCTQSNQCVATTICSQGRCACKQEDIFIGDDCYKSTYSSTFTFT